MVGLSRCRRLTVLAICCLGVLIVGLDNTIENVALPSIGRELHTTVINLQWIFDACTLVLASSMMPSGSTVDRAGRRRGLAAVSHLGCRMRRRHCRTGVGAKRSARLMN